MIERPHDVIVIGLGAMGSAAVYHLSRRGYRVLGLEAFGRGHERGSSHGRSRITREAYNEAREYVSLVRRANALWSALAEESGRSLFVETGGLNIGRPEATLVSGSLAAAKAENILHEYLTAAEVNARFPAYRLPDGFMAVYEPKAGLLYPEVCTAAHLDRAASLGADLHFDEPVRRWVADGSGVRVETGRATYWADRLVIAAGPWAGEVLSDLGLPLEVWRILHVHFEPDSEDRFSVGRCPWAMWDVSEGVYAAFTALPGDGVKFGRHDVGEVCTPDSARRGVEDAEVETLRQRLNAFMPGAGGAVKWTLTCLYTVTPDHHFVIDRHPEHPQVAYACGFSGHGFKFASVVGEILADLAEHGKTGHDIRFLSASRFAVAATGSDG